MILTIGLVIPRRMHVTSLPTTTKNRPTIVMNPPAPKRVTLLFIYGRFPIPYSAEQWQSAFNSMLLVA